MRHSPLVTLNFAGQAEFPARGWPIKVLVPTLSRPFQFGLPPTEPAQLFGDNRSVTRHITSGYCARNRRGMGSHWGSSGRLVKEMHKATA